LHKNIASGKILAQFLRKFFSCASLVGSCYFILLQMDEPFKE